MQGLGVAWVTVGAGIVLGAWEAAEGEEEGWRWEELRHEEAQTLKKHLPALRKTNSQSPPSNEQLTPRNTPAPLDASPLLFAPTLP